MHKDNENIIKLISRVRILVRIFVRIFVRDATALCDGDGKL